MFVKTVLYFYQQIYLKQKHKYENQQDFNRNIFNACYEQLRSNKIRPGHQRH